MSNQKKCHSNAVLLRNKRTGHVYSTTDGSLYINLTTGESGHPTEAQLQASTTLPMALNMMNEKNPNLSKLIATLNLAQE